CLRYGLPEAGYEWAFYRPRLIEVHPVRGGRKNRNSAAFTSARREPSTKQSNRVFIQGRGRKLNYVSTSLEGREGIRVRNKSGSDWLHGAIGGAIWRLQSVTLRQTCHLYGSYNILGQTV
ncbi:unnamed protein product, partial [Sphacelaria rigidula]